MTRGFEIVSKYADQGLNLPYRATKQAAGYDFEAATDFTLPSIWKLNFIKVLWQLRHGETATDADLDTAAKVLKPYLVPTGIKAYMNADEYLMIANRSSNPLKRNLVLPNGVGVIDADYYDNPKNEGEIFIQLLNFGIRDVHIKKGERLGQGLFMPFLAADNEAEVTTTRTGGFGSSGK
ncbi:dUTP diphosphatase [Lactiplantibacillus mudanjiangensis]|uniref:dUTP diphosphatase n=1 Tax=Lactiplantibacillus mudanjiangensis TaxID=1296538 RepID=A0A660E7W2_9LACO|nr:dUTP diphosphatase [Lactiplantibacillus mudanjiangensis]VDG18009.1 trimetaphosphatase [Lactobacillus plantarum JDM1] [Lactiplantibacillus mudanjiangensis]VDG24824.1 trimetaphosphatase [Lactobacillus plantarum JDM1] [Lactiplantibacillus mudanjiangensis]VDG28429.1 trimetaphosphatase [Lactobacillus plantarum JDM1] [Lactiplantibacillus mudanjiangensis]VDG32288.1 trimetaphosphatase [Lactobacillus plantarum JDM1] [Lactiplantibacillus mudanjiangensis]